MPMRVSELGEAVQQAVMKDVAVLIAQSGLVDQAETHECPGLCTDCDCISQAARAEEIGERRRRSESGEIVRRTSTRMKTEDIACREHRNA